MILNDLELVLVLVRANDFLRFSAAVHTSRVSCDEMIEDRLRQCANSNCYGCRASHKLCSLLFSRDVAKTDQLS